MREIKFRCFDPSTNRMYVPAVVTGDRGVTFETGRDYEDCRPCGDIPLMQFTGLKDKNGVEIYEGDILRMEAPFDGDDNAENIVVKWHDDGGYVVEWDNGFNGGDSDLTLFGWARMEDYQFEVIGNIHQNQELL